METFEHREEVEADGLDADKTASQDKRYVK